MHVPPEWSGDPQAHVIDWLRRRACGGGMVRRYACHAHAATVR